MRPFIATITLLTLLILNSPIQGASAPPGVYMLPNLSEALKHRFDYAIDSMMKMSAFGSDQVSQAKMNAQIELDVLGERSPEDQYAVAVTYRRLELTIDGGQVPGAFDSDQPASTDRGNVYAEICRPLIHKPIRLTVDQRGTISSVEGLEEIAPEGLAGLLFDQLFGEQAAIAMFQPFLRVTDESDRTLSRPGDEWQVQRPEIPGLGVPQSELTLRMIRGENAGDIAHIEVTGEPKATMPGDAAVLPNIETRKAELSGRLKWNGTLGILDSLETESVSLMESSAQGITITVESTSTTRIKRVR